MGLKKFDQLGDAFDVSNLAMLRDAIKDDHNDDAWEFLKAYIDELNHDMAQDLVYLGKTLYYFDIELHHKAYQYWLEKYEISIKL